VQYVREQVGLAVCAIASLDDLLDSLSSQPAQPALADNHARVLAYRARYGVSLVSP
jgi:orotate phosphoribosyltransferase